MFRVFSAFLFLSLLFLSIPTPSFAASPLLTLQQDGEILAVLSPDIPSVSGLALGDLGTDGVSEILAATGYGTPTRVYALRKDGSIVGSFAPYDLAFAGGASVALCDIDHDGINEIITGAGFSGGPHVRIFTHEGIPTGKQFFAYDAMFRGGVSVLCKDITGDGNVDIITAPGPTGGPHLRIFSPDGVLESELMIPFFPENAGITLFSLPTSDTSLFVTPASFSPSPMVTQVIYSDGSLSSSLPTSSLLDGPISLSTIDGVTLREAQQSTDAVEMRNGSLFHISATPTTALSYDPSAKYIAVDLSEQRLIAYEFGIPVFSFLVSTGVASHPTPLGKTTVLAKLPTHDYSWFYGEGNPANYSLPNVRWNLRFREHYYIHSAYWHNNFGHVMSHGCVNASIPDAESIYAWADVGTPVEILE